MNVPASPDNGMPLAPPDFAEGLTHTDVRTMHAISMPRGETADSNYTLFEDPTGVLRCEVGTQPGDSRNFQLKQRNGTWTDPIPNVEKLPLIMREFWYHQSWLAQKRAHNQTGTVVGLSPGRDTAAQMNFGPYITADIRETGRAHATAQGLPGHVAICDGNRSVELYLDERTYTPSFARIRLRDGSFSPPFAFSQLPPEWQMQAEAFFRGISAEQAGQHIIAPVPESPLDIDAVDQAIGWQNHAHRYRIFMVVGTSGIGKDTVIDNTLEFAKTFLPDLRLMKTRSRVTDRERRKKEGEDENIYVTKERFLELARDGKLIHPYQSRFDDKFGYDPDVLRAELQTGNVALTIANSDHYLGVHDAIRQRLKTVPVLCLVDKDIDQTHVSIDERDADSLQKNQRIESAKQFQAGFRNDIQRIERTGEGPEIHTIINNYMMHYNSVARFLSIIGNNINR